MYKLLYSNINDYDDNEINSFYNHIYNEKKKRISNYINKNRIKSSIISEILLKELLEKENEDYSKLIVKTNKYGKPYIVNKKLFFNISHSNDYIITILSTKEIGIDIEKIRDTNLNIINIFATDKEKEYILSDKKDIYKRLLQIYTLKEAYFKMKGTDLSNLKEVEFTIHNNKVICSDKDVTASTSFEIDNYVYSICQEKNH